MLRSINWCQDGGPTVFPGDEAGYQRKIVRLLRDRGPSASKDMMEATGLSRSTVLRIADQLCEQGLLAHVDTSGSRAAKPTGKPPHFYEFNDCFASVLAVCVTDNSLCMAVTDFGARVKYLLKETLYDDEDIDSVVARIAAFCEDMWNRPGSGDKPCIGLSVATQGVVNPESGIVRSVSRFPSWGRNLPLKDLLVRRVGDRFPVFIDNILRLSAVAESRRGAGAGALSGVSAPSAILVNLYVGWEGLGAGIVIDGALFRGSEYLAGEIGHMCINSAETETCSCGSKGCFEQQVSPQRLLSRAGKKYRNELDSVFAAYRAGDPGAGRFMDEIARWMAVGIGNLNLILNPHIVVLSGVYKSAGEKFLLRILELMQNLSIANLPKNLQLIYSNLNEESSIVGGALRLIDRFLG